MSMFDKRKDAEPSPEPSFGSSPAETRPAAPEPVSRSSAVIGKTITIQGDIAGEENLVIEGKVNGTVQLKNNDLTVGQSGRVTANLAANVVRIDGEVKGDITGVEKVVITKSGRVQGNIVAPRVTLEDGAKFKGSIDMDPGGAERAAPAQPSKSASSGRPAAMGSVSGEGAGKA